MKSVDFGMAFCREGRLLFNAMWMEPVNPENRIIGTVADAIDSVAVGKLHGAVQAKRF